MIKLENNGHKLSKNSVTKKREEKAIELVGMECALGHLTGVHFHKTFALINPPYWIYLHCSK